MPLRSVVDHAPTWATWAVSAIVGIGAIGAALRRTAPGLVAAWQKRKTDKVRDQVLQNARVLRATHLLSKEWVVKLGAQRVLFIHAKDSGKPWPPDSPLYVSCIDQAVAQSEQNTWERWQDWRCDPAYRQLLLDVIVSEASDRGVLIYAATMEPCALKDAYDAQGTVASVLLPVRWFSDGAFVFASINFGRAGVTANERPAYELAARNFFMEPESVRVKIEAARHIWKDQ